MLANALLALCSLEAMTPWHSAVFCKESIGMHDGRREISLTEKRMQVLSWYTAFGSEVASNTFSALELSPVRMDCNARKCFAAFLSR